MQKAGWSGRKNTPSRANIGYKEVGMKIEWARQGPSRQRNVVRAEKSTDYWILERETRCQLLQGKVPSNSSHFAPQIHFSALSSGRMMSIFHHQFPRGVSGRRLTVWGEVRIATSPCWATDLTVAATFFFSTDPIRREGPSQWSSRSQGADGFLL